MHSISTVGRTILVQDSYSSEASLEEDVEVGPTKTDATDDTDRSMRLTAPSTPTEKTAEAVRDRVEPSSSHVHFHRRVSSVRRIVIDRVEGDLGVGVISWEAYASSP
ncbi:hypothetical protein Tco_0910267 [Tanacetum coccineum]|uniref:Uncharacterized protein n=1 Tax=Tanacetum coccineum TaxID=301880 RepID=A0ABQ5CU65_9ASTR